ncbi:MAG: ester cyclase [Bauldia sp.]|nr:ester cyclase [Bauldia sp.]
MSGLDLKRRLEGFIREVWDQGDVEATGRYLAPLYTIHHDPGDPWERRVLDLDGYKERLRQSRAPFPDQKFDIQRLCADGNAVAMTWLWNGTHLGDIPGFAATGRILRLSGATTYFFTPERTLTGHWQVTDRLGVWRQLQANAGGAAA